MPLPKLPKLGAGLKEISAHFKPSLKQSRGIKTSFQRRPALGRRKAGGIRQQEIGDPLELRAAQDVQGSLDFRIVYAEIQRRGLLFEAQDNYSGTGVPVVGFTVDFLIESVQPYVALDVLVGWQHADYDYPHRDEYKAVALEAAGVRYAAVWDQDIRQSAERLEQLLDDIIGQPTGTYMMGNTQQPGEMQSPPGIVLPATRTFPYSGLQLPDAFQVGLPAGGYQGNASNIVKVPMQHLSSIGSAPAMMLQDLSLGEQISLLTHLIQNHGQAHAQGGADAVSSVGFTEHMAKMMKNNSGAMVPRGSAIKIDTSVTTYMSFTTSTTRDDHRVGGVTLEDIPSTGFGLVAIGGHVKYCRVASGTTIYQYLRQSATAGVWEGTAEPTPGTCAIAVSDRDATTGTCEVMIEHMHGASTVYDSVTKGGINVSFYDDFSGLAAAVNSSDHYNQAVAGTGTAPTFIYHATTGRTYCRLGRGVDVAADSTYVRFNQDTFQPRAAEDWGFKCEIGEITSPVVGAGALHYLAGMVQSSGDETANGIYFRSLDRGNWFLVCKNASGTTTVDLGVAPSATSRVLEFRITGDGTSVQAYVDSIATGAAITTHIHTTNCVVSVLVLCSADITTVGEVALYGMGMQSGF